MWHTTAKPFDDPLGEDAIQVTKCWEGTVHPPTHRCYICALEKALAVALFHSTLTITSKPMKDILGEETVECLEREAEEKRT